MIYEIPILTIGSKDENGEIHTLESLKKLEIENEECELKGDILYFKKEIKYVLGQRVENNGRI